MRKYLTFGTILIIILLINIIAVSAVVQTITFNWEELGAKKIGITAVKEDYLGENVHNLRCNYSSWDSAQEYLWLVSDWSNAKQQPGWIYLGKQDMSVIEKISFDYVTDSSSDMTSNKVSLTKDKEGKQVIATAQITESTGALAGPLNLDMQITERDYNGDIYLYIEYTARAFVGNLVFTNKDDGTTPPPTQEPSPTPERTASPIPTSTKVPTKTGTGTSSTGDNSVYIYIAVGLIVVVGAVVIFFIWKKK